MTASAAYLVSVCSPRLSSGKRFVFPSTALLLHICRFLKNMLQLLALDSTVGEHSLPLHEEIENVALCLMTSLLSEDVHAELAVKDLRPHLVPLLGELLPIQTQVRPSASCESQTALVTHSYLPQSMSHLVMFLEGICCWLGFQSRAAPVGFHCSLVS